MKRIITVFVILIFVFSLTIGTSAAAEAGEMEIASEKVTGEVGDIVKVNFYLYPNLPDDRKLDSLSGRLKFDPEFLTFGTINLIDEEENLKSLMNSKAGNFQYNEKDPGEIRFAFSDAYGVEEEGFWFQAEFRIEKEGATAFVFNGMSYSGLKTIKNEDGSTTYNAVSYSIEPISRGGVYTEGQSVPTDGEAEETFEPLSPVVQTPAPTASAPSPSNGGHTVPVTSTLPTYSAEPSRDTGLVTPHPPVTSVPMTTPGPKGDSPDPSQGTDIASGATPGTGDSADATPPAVAETTIDPVTGEVITIPVSDGKQAGETDKLEEDSSPSAAEILLKIGIIVGIVAVLALGVLAIVLVLKRRNMSE